MRTGLETEGDKYVCCSCRLNRPPVPSRTVSLGGSSIPENTMESLVGRAKYDGPVCARVKNVQLNSMVPEGYCDRLFQQDDDTYSMRSYATSIAPSEYDDNLNCSIPSATVTTTDGVNISLSQESNSSVLSSSSSESPKDQPPTTGEIKRKTSSFQRKHNVKGRYRMKPLSCDNLTDGTSFKRSISPHDVIKEGEVLDLGQENDIIPIETPRPTSPMHVSCCNCNYDCIIYSHIYRNTWIIRNVLLGDWLIRNPCPLQECMKPYRYCIPYL